MNSQEGLYINAHEVLFIIVQTVNNPDIHKRQMDKLWYIHAVLYDSTKGKQLWKHVMTWMQQNKNVDDFQNPYIE